MNAFFEGFARGMLLAGALVFLPLRVFWFVLKASIDPHGLYRCHILYSCVKVVERDKLSEN